MDTTAAFLDQNQYSREAIEAYERVYGEDFVSTGGRETAALLLGRLGLEPGAEVLDVGCGLGGSAFLLAREHGARVHGVDLSTNMIALAEERLARHGLGDQVRFEHGDCLELDLAERYDLVHSRDVFLHVHDKARLFLVLRRALRPGGRLLVTDYTTGPPPWSDGFADYVERHGYALHSAEDYAALLQGAGFTEVRSEDLTALFLDVHRRELAGLGPAEEDDGFTAGIRDGWAAKIARAERGEQRWTLFTARRA